MTESELARVYPWIPWRDPIHVEIVDGPAGLACRICVAIHGLRASEVAIRGFRPAPDADGDRLFPDAEAFRAHLDAAHPRAGA